MKKNILTIITVIGVGLLYYISVSGLKYAASTDAEIVSEYSNYNYSGDTFTNCIFNSPYSEVLSWVPPRPILNVKKQMDKYNELNYNAIQWYDWGSGEYGLSSGQLSEEQINNFKNLLDTVKNPGNLYGFYERSFLSKYCYGQRLIYEEPAYTNDTTTNYGFVYRNRETGTRITDMGRSVIFADSGVHSPGYLCRDIYENLQHSDLFDFRQIDSGIWYLKPLMRIPFGTANSKKVVRIEVIKFDGNILDSIIIKAENFSDTGYVGKYNGLMPPLEISGDTNSASLNHGRDEEWKRWDTTCKVDFRIYWYGECDVWFDKIIVDDRVANELFDINSQGDINDRIFQEADNFTNHGSLYSFFMDEITISQVPCFKYIIDKMRYYEPSARLSFALTNYLHIHGLRNDNLNYQIYFDSLSPSFVQADHHGFSESNPKIPDVFPEYDEKIPSGWFAKTTEDYNSNLQTSVFGSKTDVVTKNEAGSLLYEIHKTRNGIQTYSSSADFIMQPQIHGWLFTNGTNENYSLGLREPTNEEIQAQAMLAISHGADALCWFVYNSHIWKNTTGIPQQYMLGLLNPEDDTSRRTENCYGQDKWQYVSEMNEKILKWANVLENTDWKQGYSIHSEGAGNEYISDIKSIKRNSYSPYNFSETNIDTVKYWEEGFFEPKITSVNDRSKYFLIVNRRCVPEAQTGTGDIRWLKIRFNSSSLSEFRNWKLEDIYTGESLIFNRSDTTSGGYIDLGNQQGDMGYFLSGEGKLFKLAPVMQEGGTLVCDEYLSSGSINCDSTVFNNGFDITINKDVTISFSTKGEIVMEGGEFKCGLDPQMSQNRVELNNAIFQTTERKFIDFKSFLFFQYLNLKQ